MILNTPAPKNPIHVQISGAVTEVFRVMYQGLIREPSSEASEVRSGAG